MFHGISRLLGRAALIGAVAAPVAAFAQGAPVVSRPVVQAVPGEDSKKLSAALSRIGRDPRDINALVDAGDAARGLRDFAAAIGFYKRADEISPGNARVKAGLGSAYVLSGDPVSAIPAFDAAAMAGASPSLIAGDRALAYDLVGDNATAQRYYAMALPVATGDPADEMRMRLAVSQAIGGHVDTSYTTLLPLLNKSDKPGWRTRAFTLAIAGQTEDAVKITDRILPPQLAQNIAPYLRYMPRLTKAQQAAAANLGRFPRASEIGRDDARIAAYAPPSATAAGGGLIPKGEPLGGTKLAKADRTTRTSRAARAEAERAARNAVPARTAMPAATDPDRVAPPEPRPAIERSDGGELPAVARGAPMTATAAPSPATPAPSTPAPSTAAPAQVAKAEPKLMPAPAPAPVPAPSAPKATGFDLARLGGTTAATPTPSPSPTPAPVAAAVAPAVPPPPVPQTLAEIFADIGKPTVDVVPTAGAVDIRQITPAAPPPPRVVLPKVEEDAADAKLAEAKAAEAKAADAKVKAAEAKAKAVKDAKAKAAEEAKAKAAEAKLAEAKAKAKKASQPSRLWVQIGVGRDKAAIAFDWRRYTRENAALLKGRAPYVSEMGRTNRILVGPFASQKAVNAFLVDAKKQGFSDALPWTSPAGQVVDPLSDK